MDVFCAGDFRAAFCGFSLALLAPLVDLCFGDTVAQSPLNSGSRSDPIDPLHDSGFRRDIDLAPLPPSNPRIQCDVRNGELVAANPRIVPQLLVEHRDESQRFSAKSLQGMGFLLCLLYTSPSPRDLSTSRMPSSA